LVEDYNEKMSRERTGLEVAVIGMAGRFPGAKNIAQLWENLKNGVESITFYTKEQLEKEGKNTEEFDQPNFVGAVVELEDKEMFDAAFFGYTPIEAQIMDPQARHLHETTWEALEDSGYDPDNYRGQIGLYVGASPSFNWEVKVLLSGKAMVMGEFASSLFSNRDFVSTRISYNLNLRGPSFSLQTACSTSLVAIDQAVRGLLTGQCDIAIAGGVKISTIDVHGYPYQEGMIHSPDGHCRAFDADAQGTIGGQGCGVVVLKLLEDAENDGDHIDAVILGTAVNNDGRRKVGYTAPSIDGQAQVVETAMHMAEVEPESIGFIETHGTATPLGDPIEVNALIKAYDTEKKNYCALGAIKTNLGHLDSAAGVTGFIKTVLVLKQRMLPPTLHYQKPNPQIDFQNSPFYVNAELKPWRSENGPLRAAVSSFGIGGTNAHIVMEEWKPEYDSGSSIQAKEATDARDLFLYSARTPSALGSQLRNHRQHLEQNRENPGLSTGDIAHTLQVGRRAFEYRRAITAANREELIQALEKIESSGNQAVAADHRPVVFMFSGLGSQYVNMGRGLYDNEPRFREHMGRCFERQEQITGRKLKDILYPESTEIAPWPDHADAEITQQAVYIFEYSLARLMMDWGLKPHAMIGYSFGEYVAATISEVLTMEDALKLVVLRGQGVQQMPPGVMLSIPQTVDQVQTFLTKHHRLAVAIDNGSSTIVGGPEDAVMALEKELKEKRQMTMRIAAHRAIHTPMMEPAAQKYREQVATVSLKLPKIPYISNRTGQWITDRETTDPEYWARHLCETIKFADGVQQLVQEPRAMYLEIGPGRDLSTLMVRYLDDPARQPVFNLVKAAGQEKHDEEYLLDKVGKMWQYGVNFNWNDYNQFRRDNRNENRKRVSLPTYPFEGKRFWIDNLNLTQMETVKKNGQSIDQTKAQTRDQTRDQKNKQTNNFNIEDFMIQQQDGLRHKRPLLSTEFEAPETETEKKLIEIWEELFGIEGIGRQDDFFELRGDSLKAIVAASKINREMNVQVPLTEFFKSPTVRKMSVYIENAEKKSHEAIQPVEKREYYPQSSAQRRLFFLDKMEDIGTSYNLPAMYYLAGNVHDVREQFKEIFGKLIHRHESLRTSFFVHENIPVQKVHDLDEIRFELEEYPNSDGSEDRERLAGHAKNSMQRFVRPFDLTKAPLLRIGLVELTHKEYLLLFDQHHIISDGTSIGILGMDFFRYLDGDEPEPLTVQYKDFAQWQDRQLKNGIIKEKERYWQEQFSDIAEMTPLDLPTDRPRPPVFRFEGDNYHFPLEKVLGNQLKILGKESGVTLNMIMLTAFYVLLNRYTGREDIVVGSGIMGRPHADLQGVIGMFVNSLPLRNRPNPHKTLREFLEEVKENSIQAYENQEVQFEDMVETLNPPRDPSRNPVFDVSLVVQNFEISEELKGGNESNDKNENEERTEPKESLITGMEHKTSKFDMTMFVHEVRENISLLIEYSTALFDEDTIQRMVNHYCNVLRRMQENLDMTIGEIDLIGEEERKQLTMEFNRTDTPYPAEKTIHQLFEEQAERTPRRIAVTSGTGGTTLTYRGLDEKVHRLAVILGREGVTENTIVVLKMERSAEIVIAMLAVLKAGGAYLPLDPSHPNERNDSILRDSNAKLVLEKSEIQNTKHETIRDDRNLYRKNSTSDIESMIELEPRVLNYENLNLERRADDEGTTSHLSKATSHTPAYIIYTSGTTGRPKGVIIEHRGIANLIGFWQSEDGFGVGEDDRVGQFANVTFDASVSEIFMALFTGAELCIIPREVVGDPSACQEFIEENRITLITLPPPYLVYMNPQKCTVLRTLITAGSETNPELVKAWSSGRRYINAYGPTESTICATAGQVNITGEPNRYETVIPIGKPIQNTQIYILDSRERIQPVGIPGELTIAGVGLARGYLNRPDLTAEKFIELQNLPGAQEYEIHVPRLYKTGDRARWRPDGTIQFLGRVDRQVKIRGIRIEPAEIENRLVEHPSIKDAVVRPMDATNGEKFLTAYITAPANEAPAQEEIRRFLARRLPEHMIPSHIIPMESFPLTAGGKVDEKALPEPVLEGQDGNAPEGRLESQVADIWAEVLEIPREDIPANRSFFELGGHSLRATIVISRIKVETGVKIPLGDFFKHQTIQEQAHYIQGAEKDQVHPLEPVEEKEYYPLTFNQKRLWFIHQLDSSSAAYNLGGDIYLGPQVDTRTIKQILNREIIRHEGFRTGFLDIDGEPVQRVYEFEEMPLEEVELAGKGLSEEELAETLAQIKYRVNTTPFDLEKPPLIRITLVNLPEGNKYLIYIMHHIISDGWSMDILRREFVSQVGIHGGPGSQPAPLTLQYRDYCQWQERYLSRPEVIEESYRYWKERMTGGIPEFRIPYDFKEVKGNRESAGYRIVLGETEMRNLQRLAVENDSGMYVSMLSLLILLQSRMANTTNVVTGILGAGRDEHQLQDIVGFFVNTLILTFRVDLENTFAQHQQRVNEEVMQMMQYQAYPMELVFDRMKMKYPEISVLFNMFSMSTTAEEMELSNIESRHIERVQDTKFDQVYYMTQFKNGVNIECHYQKELYKPEKIEFIMLELQKLALKVTAEPHKKIKDSLYKPRKKRSGLMRG
jgi:amino acid adenylation domain-containing protein